MSFTMQRYCARNDPNGNPRRVLVVRDGNGDVIGVGRETREGRTALVRDTLWALGLDSAEVTDIGDVDVRSGIVTKWERWGRD